MEKENFGLRQISRTEKVSMGTFGNYEFWERTGQRILSAEKLLRQSWTNEEYF